MHVRVHVHVHVRVHVYACACDGYILAFTPAYSSSTLVLTSTFLIHYKLVPRLKI